MFFLLTFFRVNVFLLINVLSNLGVFYSWCQFQLTFFTFWCFAPNDVFHLQPFVPVSIFSIQPFVLFGIFSDNVLSVDFFTIGVFYFCLLAVNLESHPIYIVRGHPSCLSKVVIWSILYVVYWSIPWKKVAEVYPVCGRLEYAIAVIWNILHIGRHLEYTIGGYLKYTLSSHLGVYLRRSSEVHCRYSSRGICTYCKRSSQVGNHLEYSVGDHLKYTIRIHV
jgi:hypothetical protein